MERKIKKPLTKCEATILRIFPHAKEEYRIYKKAFTKSQRDSYRRYLHIGTLRKTKFLDSPSMYAFNRWESVKEGSYKKTIAKLVGEYEKKGLLKTKLSSEKLLSHLDSIERKAFDTLAPVSIKKLYLNKLRLDVKQGKEKITFSEYLDNRFANNDNFNPNKPLLDFMVSRFHNRNSASKYAYTRAGAEFYSYQFFRMCKRVLGMKESEAKAALDKFVYYFKQRIKKEDAYEYLESYDREVCKII